MAGNDYERVGDLVTLVRGTTYKGALVGKPGPALLGLGSIVPGGGFRVGDFKTYGGECPEQLMLRPGDLYVSLKGATKDGEMIGSVAQVPSQVASGRLTQDTVKLAIAPEFEELRQYLYWLLRTPQYRAYCAGCARGSAVVALSRDDFLAYPVPRFTALRATVVALLKSLDDKIELNRRMNETLEAMAQAIFRDWFVDFGPTRRKLEGATDPLTVLGGLVQDAERAKTLTDLFPAALGNDGLPEGWTETTLESYSSLNPESWSAKTAPDQVEYVDLANTKWGTIDSTSVYSWKDAPSRARRIVRSGDTIVGTVRPGNGSYAFVGRDGLTASTGFAVLRPKQAEFYELVNCAATSPENIQRLEKLADGGAYPAVKPEVVIATPVPLVPADVASAFSGFAAPIFEKIESSKEENCALAATRDLLLPKLMSGEIRLPEAEEVKEAAQ